MEHLSLNTGILDLILILLGFTVGQVTKFKTPILVAILMVKMARWYLQTHPQGKKMAKKTDIGDQFQKLLEDHQCQGEG